VTNDEDPAGSQAVGLNQAAVDWAWAQQIANNPGARVVLMCLARRVNEAWECTASQEEVAMDALVSGRSARRYLDQLEEGGFIARQRRVSETGSRLPDGYRLNPGAPLPANLDGRQVGEVGSYRPNRPLANLATGSDQQESLPANVDSGDGGDGSQWPNWPLAETHNPSSEPLAKLATGQIGQAIGVSSSSKEELPPTTKRGAGGKNSAANIAEHPRFAEWYAAYPIHKAPAAARKAFNKAVAKVDDIAVLVDAALRYRTDPQVLRGFGKHPATWLNGECWLDEPVLSPQMRAEPGNGSGSQVPPRGARRQNPFRSKRETA
jgi:hypothetical protein